LVPKIEIVSGTRSSKRRFGHLGGALIAGAACSASQNADGF